MAPARTAYLCLLGMAVCFGGTWPAGKLAVEEVPPFTVAAVRFSIATALLALWAGARHGPIRAPGRANLPLVLAMGATAVAGYNVFFLYGLELAPASDGAIIVPGFAPVFTVLLGWAVLGERVRVPPSPASSSPSPGWCSWSIRAARWRGTGSRERRSSSPARSAGRSIC